MVCPGSFLSCGENHSDTKSGWDLDPDKPRFTVFCQGDQTDPIFLRTFFWICVPNSRLLQPTLELVIGSAPVAFATPLRVERLH